METKTHLGTYYGQATQFEAGTSFPTSRDVPEYQVGNLPQLEDGDVYYIIANQVLGVHTGSTWNLIQFITA